MKKPRVFIGSSSEGESIAHAIEEHLVQETEPVLWTSDVFLPSSTNIESLENTLDTVEFSVLVVTPDDIRTKRDSVSRVPRDNVIFELGLFMGKLGRSRTFIVTDDITIQLPTDLLGMTLVSFDSRRSDSNVKAAVSPAASKILRVIKRTPRRHPIIGLTSNQSTLFDEDQFLHAIVSWPGRSKSITICYPHTIWAWKLFPALLAWRLSNIPILVRTNPISGKTKNVRQEKARRKLLNNLGIRVDEVQELKKVGFFRNAEYEDDSCVIVCNENPGSYTPFALKYDGASHCQAVIALMEGTDWLKHERKDIEHVPELSPYDPSKVIDTLRKGVHQYSSPHITLKVEKVKTSSLYLMTPFVRQYKYNQIEFLFQEYERIGVEPFGTIKVRFKSGECTVVTPPVVEIHDIGPVVIEGTTRATFCFNRNIDQFLCILVSGAKNPLPGNPVPINQVNLANRSLAPAERMEGFNYIHFRHIERAVHPY